MTTPPAGWYDDPEDPSQYRYWDGTLWTVHRAPRGVPAAPVPAGGASSWNLFPRAFNAIGATWRQLLLLATPTLFLSVAFGVVAIVAMNDIFDNKVDEVVERVSDGVLTPADEAFIENVDVIFPTTSFWVLIGVGGLSILVGLIVAAAMNWTLVAAMHEQHGQPADAFRQAMRRSGRVVGWSILAGATLSAGLVVAILVPPLFLLYLLLAIWLWPYGIAFGAALFVAPTRSNPVGQAKAIVSRNTWRRAAVHSLVLTVFLFCIGFGSMVMTQMFVVGPTVALVGSGLVLAVQWVLIGAGLVAWWVGLDGEVDPQLEAGSTPI